MPRSHLIATAAFGVFACTAQAAEKTAPSPGFGAWGFDLSGEDTTVKPGNNFFDYANGTAVKNMVIPPDRTNFGAFIVLVDLSETRGRSGCQGRCHVQGLHG